MGLNVMPANDRTLVPPAALPPMRLQGAPARRSGGRAFLPQVGRVFYALTAFALPSLGFALSNGLPGGDVARSNARFIAPLALGETPPAERTGKAPRQTPRYRLSSIRMP